MTGLLSCSLDRTFRFDHPDRAEDLTRLLQEITLWALAQPGVGRTDEVFLLRTGTKVNFLTQQEYRHLPDSLGARWEALLEYWVTNTTAILVPMPASAHAEVHLRSLHARDLSQEA